MIAAQRRKKILEKLRVKDICSFNDLAEEFKVSRVTVQRDIKLLEEEKLVTKIHNVVKLIKKNSEWHIETRFRSRLRQNIEEKLEIATKAIPFVYEGKTIFLDSSSTVYIFAKELFEKKFLYLDIITNSISILCESLVSYPNFNIISTGGEVNKSWHMFTGRWVIDFLRKVNISQAFISTAGISSDKKITTSSNDLANILSIVFNKSIEVNLLVDSSKFFKSGMINIASIKECKRIITSEFVDKNIIMDFKKIKGLELIY